MVVHFSSTEPHHLQEAIRQECEYPLSDRQWYAICVLQATALDEWAPPPPLPIGAMPSHAIATSNATRVLCGLVMSTWNDLQTWLGELPPSMWAGRATHLVTWGILQSEEGPLDTTAAEAARRAARRALWLLATAERPLLLTTLHAAAANAPRFAERKVMELLVAALALAGPLTTGSDAEEW